MTEAMPTGPTVDRTQYIGASEVGTLLGLNPFGTDLDVYAEKVGIKKDETMPMVVGKEIERGIIEAYRKTLAPAGAEFSFPGTLLSVSHPNVGATADAIEYSPAGKFAVEIKATGMGVRRQWKSTDLGGDGVPRQTYCQVQMQASLFEEVFSDKLDGCKVVRLDGTQLSLYEFGVDRELAGHLRIIAQEWYEKYVTPRIMPDVGHTPKPTVQALLGRLSKQSGEVIEALPDDLIISDCISYNTAAKQEKKWKDEKQQYANRIAAFLTEREALGVHAGKVEAMWNPRKGSISYKDVCTTLGVDKQTLEKHRGKGSRVLSVKINEEQNDD